MPAIIFALPLPCLAIAVKCRRMLLPASNANATAPIERRLYCPPLTQLLSITPNMRQRPPLSIATIKC
jgi:hypothetical protein